jgi:integrase
LQLLIYAIKNELIKNLTNPIGSSRVRMPKVENQKIGFFTKEKAQELLELLQQRENQRLYELTTLLLFTGARFSEVARLTWSDINFNTNLRKFKTLPRESFKMLILYKIKKIL